MAHPAYHDFLKETPVDELTYESALSELEAIVAALETQEQSLDLALQLFERGQLLVKRCGDLLNQAELKVRQISSSNESETLIDFDLQV